MGQLPIPADIRLLFEGSKIQHIAKGEVLHTSEQSKKLLLIISGFVKRYFIAHEGSLGTQVIYGANDVLPMTVVYEQLFEEFRVYNGPEVYYYETITNVTLCMIDAATLQQKVDANPTLYRALLYNSGLRLQSNIQFLENLRLHGAYSKTAHQLAHLAHKFGTKIDDGIKIQTPLIHQDIADIIGTTRETVTASIIKLREKNLIRTDKRFIVVLNYDGLVREAYG